MTAKRKASLRQCKDRPFMLEAAYDEKHRYLRYDEFRRARAKALKRDGGKCVCCSSTENLVAHHIVPWILSGSHSVDNLVILCPSCHFVVGGGTMGWTSRGWRRLPITRIRRIMKRFHHAISNLGYSQRSLNRRIWLLKEQRERARGPQPKLNLDDFM